MKVILHLIILILFAGCSQSKTETSLQSIVVDINSPQSVSVFDVIDSISIVPLETTDSCLVAVITQIEKKGDRLYILDQKQEIFFCFNLEGKILFKINRYGNGPGEYQNIESFTIDKKGNIYLLEPWGSIYHFDPNGKFINKIRLPGNLQSYNDIFSVDSSLIIINMWGDVLHFSPSNGTHTLFKVETTDLFCPLKRSYVYNDKMRMATLFDSKVMELGKQGFTDCYRWDFLKQNNDEASIKHLKTILNRQTTNTLDYIGPGKHLKQFIYYVFETNRYEAALMEYNNDFLHVFHDKIKNKNIVFKRTKENTVFHTSFFKDNTLIYYTQPFIKGWRDLTCIKPELLDDRNRKILENYREEEDNPLITIFWLKN